MGQKLTLNELLDTPGRGMKRGARTLAINDSCTLPAVVDEFDVRRPQENACLLN